MSAPDLLAALAHDPSELASPDFRGRLSAAPVQEPFPAVNAAIQLREQGYYADADAVFERILAFDPNYLFALHDYSVSCARQGRLEQAARLAGRAYAEDGRLSIASNYALILAALGRHEAAARVLGAVAPAGMAEHALLISNLQFARYLAEFPHRAARAVALEAETSGFNRDEEAVSDLILGAAARRQPFSLVRLGDGEGAWVIGDLDEEARYAALYDANRRSFLNDWFGDEALLHAPAFLSAAQEVWSAVEAADLVGVPPSARIDHEYLLLSPRGAPSCTNVLRKLGLWHAPASRDLCSHHIGHQLAHIGFFGRLWRSGAPVGLITSHRELGRLIEAAGATLALEHHLPGDNRNPWRDPVSGARLQHFPHVYEAVVEALRGRDLRGVVVLIGAGFVGKVYCQVVRQAGGVAVDVGSVLDGWAHAGAVP